MRAERQPLFHAIMLILVAGDGQVCTVLVTCDLELRLEYPVVLAAGRARPLRVKTEKDQTTSAPGQDRRAAVAYDFEVRRIECHSHVREAVIDTGSEISDFHDRRVRPITEIEMRDGLVGEKIGEYQFGRFCVSDECIC